MLDRKEKIIWIISCIFICFFTSCASQNDLSMLSSSELTDMEQKTDLGVESTDQICSTQEIIIDLRGEVVSPGIYKMQLGDRVYQLIEKAGGFTDEAYIEDVNQASCLEDGQQIIIYDFTQWQEKQEALQVSKEDDSGGKININLATEEVLCQLPGIGSTRARAIIDYREKNGEFHANEDIMKVPGIKEGSYDKLKDFISVN